MLQSRCLLPQAGIPLVFHRSGDRILSFRRSWTKACARAGLPALLFHDLRRSAVRNLERAGISRSVAMKLTGHKTESVDRRYAIVAESDLRAAGEKLSAAATETQARTEPAAGLPRSPQTGAPPRS
jgi:integrase